MRAGGCENAAGWLHAVPLRTHVSATCAAPTLPPNSTICFRIESYVDTMFVRALGVAVPVDDHAVPVHEYVALAVPAHITSTPRLASNASASTSVPVAGPAVEPLSVQFVPSNVHVCWSALEPPNMST